MNNLKKEFVEYTKALELKQLGFDEPCFGHYQQEWHDDGMTELEPSLQMVISKQHQHAYQICTAPLYQQAFRWFREKYNLDSHIKKDWTDGVFYGYEAIIECEDGFIDVGTYNTYEEAELACLNKLIEIVKEKQQ